MAVAHSTHLQARQDRAIRYALNILLDRLREPGAALNSPRAVRQYLALTLGERPYEVFMVLFLDAQNRVLASEEMFRGTLTQTIVHPREIVKRALHHNANSVILCHNHPSGVPDPSQADRDLTKILKTALELVDVRVQDHLIVAGDKDFSFCERGWL